MPDKNHPGGSTRTAPSLRLVPPSPAAARRPSLLAVLAGWCAYLVTFAREWVFSHVSYQESERSAWEWRLRGYCYDCDSRVDVAALHGHPFCGRCGGRSVGEIGSLYMLKGSEVEP